MDPVTISLALAVPIGVWRFIRADHDILDPMERRPVKAMTAFAILICLAALAWKLSQ